MEKNITAEFIVLADNIIEFERFFEIACRSMRLNTNDFTYSKTIPTVLTHKLKKKIVFKALVGFERWGDNYWQSKENKSLFISENPDVLVELNSHKLNKVFAIEFSSALPAGNQSWQRYGRGKQLSQNSTDYFYISELGGKELDENRNEIAIRYPNPIVNYAASVTPGNFVNLLVERPGCPDRLSQDFKGLTGTKILEQYIIDQLSSESNSQSILKHQNTIKHQKSIISKYIEKKKRKSSFEQDFLNSEVIDPSINVTKSWKKKRSINTTEDTDKILFSASNLANSYFGSTLPFTRIESNRSKLFFRHLQIITKHQIDVDDKKPSPTVYFAALAGFKPRGDDARPDRGLLPLVDSLSGPDDLIVTLVFGPATADTEKNLSVDVSRVAENNGLWGSIFQYSDHVIITSEHFSHTMVVKGYRGETKTSNLPLQLYQSGTIPKTNENDVDTAIHLICTRDSNLFESFCNPPGGDWSGVSFYNTVLKCEVRYLTLNRAPHPDKNKRPDHIYHDYQTGNVIVIESKTTFSSLLKEKNVGNKMVNWTNYLLSHVPQVFKRNNTDWLSNTTDSHQIKDIKFIRGGAFFHRNENHQDLQELMKHCSLDFILAYKCLGDSWKVEILTNNSYKSTLKCFEHLDHLHV